MIAKILSKRTAANITIVILALIMIFHLLILIGVIPYSITWGGRITTRSHMIVFESISLFVNLVFILIILLRVGYIKTSKTGVPQVGIWIIFGIFVLNTVGNLLSESSLERAVFTPMTLILSILTYRLAIKK